MIDFLHLWSNLWRILKLIRQEHWMRRIIGSLILATTPTNPLLNLKKVSTRTSISKSSNLLYQKKALLSSTLSPTTKTYYPIKLQSSNPQVKLKLQILLMKRKASTNPKICKNSANPNIMKEHKLEKKCLQRLEKSSKWLSLNQQYLAIIKKFKKLDVDTDIALY